MSSVTLPDYESTTSRSAEFNGVKITTNSTITSLDILLYEPLTFIDTILITDTNNNTISEKTGLWGGGEVASVSVSLDSGESFYVGVGNDGGSHDVAYTQSVNYPYTSSDFDVTAGVIDIGTSSSDERDFVNWNIKEITATPAQPPSTPQNVSVTRI